MLTLHRLPVGHTLPGLQDAGRPNAVGMGQPVLFLHRPTYHPRSFERLPVMAKKKSSSADPWTIATTTHKGRPAELMTFTGKTESEYDAFLDARFAPGREAIGFRQDSAAKTGRLAAEDGRNRGHFRWFQFRRLIVEESPT